MEERLKKVFKEALEIEEDIINDDLNNNESPQWDSVAHMNLVAEIENEFDIMLETDDIIDMSSFKKAKEIVSKYLG